MVTTGENYVLSGCHTRDSKLLAYYHFVYVNRACEVMHRQQYDLYGIEPAKSAA